MATAPAAATAPIAPATVAPLAPMRRVSGPTPVAGKGLDVGVPIPVVGEAPLAGTAGAPRSEVPITPLPEGKGGPSAAAFSMSQSRHAQ
jgi:hypothetical protein